MALGKHIIVELHGVDPEILNDEDKLREILIEAAITAGATVIGDVFHKFSPHGVTGVVVVKESHISIHTWPEFGYAALDIFTCRGIDPNKALEVIVELLKPKYHVFMTITRGEPYREVSEFEFASTENVTRVASFQAVTDGGTRNSL